MPFWIEQVRAKEWPNHWREIFGCDPGSPIWCFDRLGMSRTRLPDGRTIYIGGEHEDYYDPNFCIYNDVTVEHPDGSIDIYSYPRSVFPPTDFHTATLISGSIYIVGTLGYVNERHPGETPVYRLDTNTLVISPIGTAGENPGWLCRHEAVADPGGNEILIRGGESLIEPNGQLLPNQHGYVLDLRAMEWRRLK